MSGRDGESARVGRHYDGARAEQYFAYQRGIGELGAELNLFKFEAHVGRGDAVVDFGCGGGGLLERLEAASKTGVEVSEPARGHARARGLDVVASLAELEAGSTDVAISNHALEHALSPLEELRGLRRVLKPGGKLVLWLPIDDWRSQRVARPDPNHHLYTWTPLLLSNLLAEAGFEQIECRVVTHAWPPYTARLARLPRPVFDLLARIWAVLRRRRQLMAVALAPQ
ncbi:MAG: class I SAM-dependent methyltransferase [Thermoleophilaceae bacterium]|nr:class I SAM-dependent methyltransferase [Thermoleophilaceae bacterium]